MIWQDYSFYKGHSINKLQNSVILLVFQILKIGNIRFQGSQEQKVKFQDTMFTKF